MPIIEVKKFNTRLAELKKIQEPYLSTWKDLRDYQAPNRGNFIEDKGKEGQRKDLKIYNGTATLAGRTLTAGMSAGITSPARPWFSITMSNNKLLNRADVKDYLRDYNMVMYQIFNRSNFYSQTSLVYYETGVFAQAPMAIIQDFKDIVRFETYTIGEYYIAENYRRVVDVVYRRLWKSAVELVQEFGKENVSQTVLNYINSGHPDTKLKVIHAVEPNDDRILSSIDSKNKKYRSVYFEEDSTEKKVLSLSGFNSFPYAVPRWSTNGSSPYGTDQPGLIALGDAKQLQTETYKKAKGLDLNMFPPLQAPADLKNTRIMNVPGGISFYNPFGSGQQRIGSLYENRIPLREIIEDMQEIEGRIRDAYYVNLFMSFLTNNRPQDMKAEVAFQIDKERLLMLGPVLERLNDELLDVVINRVSELADDAGVLPDPPQDIEGEDLKIEYVSSLAKAQKMAAIGNMERLSALAGNWAQFDPSVIDKLDFDQGIDEAGNMLDVPSSFIRSDEEASVVRQGRQQANNMKIALDSSVAAAGAAKNLANAPVGKNSILDQLTGLG